MGAIRATSLLLAVLLSGCATVSDFADQSQKANLAVEQSSNSMLLLNIVRAMHRRPMHFTAIQNVKTPIGTGSPSFTLGVTSSVLATQGSERVVSWIPSIGYKVDVPSFDVAVWDGQEFMRGITTQVDGKTLGHYLEQGWPSEMVLTLLIREVSVAGQAWLNYPGDTAKFSAFLRQMKALNACDLNVEMGEKSGPAVPSAPLITPNFMAGIAALRGQNLTLTQSPAGDYQVVNSGVAIGVSFAPRMGSKAPCTPFGIPIAQGASARSQLMGLFRIPGIATQVAAGPSLKIQLRSPEGLVYYLGELARAQLGDPVEPDREKFGVAKLDGQLRPQPLFVVNRGPVPEGVKPAVSVRYEEVDYWIPAGPDGGRSMHVLSLAQQLINAQKSAKDLPAPATIKLLTQ